MRWRDSGDVEPPRRAARNAATGTPITQSASARASVRTVTSPISASTSTTTSTGQRPVLKSPAVCHRYVTIAHGPPSFAPWPPTPTSNRPASTRSVSQNGIADDRHGRERDHRLPQALAVRGEHEHALGGEHERAVGVRGDGEQDRGAPERPALPRPAVERPEQEDERQQREEQEQAVHPGVDAVEEEHPAAGDERRRDQRRGASGEAPAEERDQGQARDREGRRDEPQAAEPEAEVRDRVGEEEVERGAAAIAGDVLDDARQAVAPDEERERLVLVRRPRHQLVEQEPRCRSGDRADPDPERVGLRRMRAPWRRAGESRGRLRLSESSGFAPHLRW